MDFKRTVQDQLRHLTVIKELSLRSAEESKYELRDFFLQQAAKVEAEIQLLVPKPAAKVKKPVKKQQVKKKK